MSSSTSFTKPSDLKNWAYETIKKEILNLRIQPGEKLFIDKLSGQLGISRTPIREALLRMENEGLVNAFSRVGFFVQTITKQDLRELFELREITESFAAEKAAPFLTNADLAHIDALHKSSTLAVEQGNLNDFNEMEIALHTFIIKHSQNRRLLKLIEGLKDLTYRERILALRSIDNIRSSLDEHRRIIDALLNKDGRLAGERMREHVRNVCERLMNFLDIPENAGEGRIRQ